MSGHASAAELPNWIFDVDDEDRLEGEEAKESLLKELEIDPGHICSNICWTLLSPWRIIFDYKNTLRRLHPMQWNHELGAAISNTDGSSKSIVDFWGPCLVVSSYAALLWLAHVNNVPWLYLVWCLAACFCHLVCRPWSQQSSLLLHLAVLGYSVTPLLPVTCLLIITHGRYPWLSTLVQPIALIFCTSSALLSYRVLLGTRPTTTITTAPSKAPSKSKQQTLQSQSQSQSSQLQEQNRTSLSGERRPRVALLGPPVALMLLYLLSLLPTWTR